MRWYIRIGNAARWLRYGPDRSGEPRRRPTPPAVRPRWVMGCRATPPRHRWRVPAWLPRLAESDRSGTESSQSCFQSPVRESPRRCGRWWRRRRAGPSRSRCGPDSSARTNGMRHHQVPARREGVAKPFCEAAQRRLVREIVEDLGADDEVEAAGQRIGLQVEALEGDVGKALAALSRAREGAFRDIGGGQTANPRCEQAREVALGAGQLQRDADRSRGQQVEGVAVLSGLVGRPVVPGIGSDEDRLPVSAARSVLLRGRTAFWRTRVGCGAGDGRQPPQMRGWRMATRTCAVALRARRWAGARHDGPG